MLYKMIDEEINSLLTNFEKDVFDFIKIVKNVEVEQNKRLSDDNKGSKPHFNNIEKKNSHKNNYDVYNSNALSQVFKITKKILKKICSLLEQFSSANERPQSNFDSLIVNYYYDKYVYQIVTKLISLLSQNLNKFSENLNEISKGRPQKQFDSSSPRRPQKLPMACAFKLTKPATLFTPHGKIFDPFGTFNDRLKQKMPPALKELPEQTLKNPFSDKVVVQNALAEENKNDRTNLGDAAYVTLKRITHSLTLLIPMLENILLHLQEFAGSRPNLCSSSAPRSPAADTADFESKPTKTCCPEFCDNCCRTCRRTHAASKLKSPRDYHKPYEDVMPLKEPSWMHQNPVTKDTHKSQDCSTEDRVCQRQKRSLPRKFNHGAKQKADEHDCRSSDDVSGRDLARSTDRNSSPDRPTSDRTSLTQPQHPSAETSSGSDSTVEFKLLGKLYGILKEGKKETPGCLRKKEYSCGQLRPRNRSPNRKTLQTWPPKTTVEDDRRKLPCPKRQCSGSSSDQDSKVNIRKNGANIPPSKNNKQGKHKQTEMIADKSSNERLSNEKRKGLRLPGEQESACSVESDEDDVPHQRRQYGSESSGTDSTNEDYFEILPLEDQYQPKSPTKIDGRRNSGAELDKGVNNFVDDVVDIAKKMALVDRSGKQGMFTEEDNRMLNKIENVTVFTTGSRASHESIGILIENVFPKATKNFPVAEACPSCLKLIDPSKAMATDFASRKYLKNLRGSQILKDTCYCCWNGCQRALTIHVCHDKLPPGVLEVRHMDYIGKICVCFLYWDMKEEADDWRWLKNPFPDNTRVEIQRKATPEEDTLIMIVYGPDHTLVKESLGETRLRIVEDHPQDSFLYSQDSTTGFDLKRQFSREERNIACKLGIFFDAIQKIGYGSGPPLVLKLRRSSLIHDAFDLLMVSSKIPLHYYRDLRVIYTSSDRSHMLRTSSNFISEDQSDELFGLFTRKIFGYEEYDLFTHASERSKVLYLNSESNAHYMWFTFAGILLGLAILHQKELDTNLAPCIFKALLSREMNLEDLQEIDPECHEMLMDIKQTNVDERKEKLTFVVKDRVRKGTVEHELIPDGKKMAVTEENKYRYMDLVLAWKLADKYLVQFNDLKKGFHSVISPGFLTNFSHKELLSIIKDPLDPEIFYAEQVRSSESELKEISRCKSL